MDWCRLWHDMPTDPKWRVVARVSGQRIGDVIAVFNLMMVCASRSPDRGTLDGWEDEDAAAALDLDTDAVTAIRTAMQGRVIDDNRLSGWDKRQPKLTDNSTDRVREFRKRKASSETTCNDDETDVKRSETIGNTDKIRLDTDTSLRSVSSEDEPRDLKSEIFGPCLNWLSRQTEKPTAKLRPMVGRWIRDHGDGPVLTALIQAAQAGPVEPVAWLEKKLTADATGPPQNRYAPKVTAAEILQLFADEERDGRSKRPDLEAHAFLPATGTH